MMRGAIVLILALAACSENPLQPGQVILTLDVEREGSGCYSADCRDYGMACGGTLMVRWVDARTGENLTDSDGEPLLWCRAIEPAEDLCALNFLDDRVFSSVPLQLARVEVAVWSPETKQDCPTGDVFDFQGAPRRSFRPQPAFAGSAYVRTRRDDSVTVPLTCPDPLQLAESCELETLPTATATIIDLDRLVEPSAEQAENLLVSVGEPTVIPVGEDESFVELDGADLTPMEKTMDEQTRFAADLPQSLGSPACVQVFDIGPEATPAATCTEIEADLAEIDLEAYWLPAGTLSQLLEALGLPGFPDQGLVVGRVVDGALNPMSGVTVNASAGTVLYLSPEGMSTNSLQTSGSGYFMSQDMPFATELTAIRNSDGRRELGSYRAGLVRSKLTTVLIRMRGDIVSP